MIDCPIEEEKRNIIKNVPVRRDPEINSDHCILKIDIPANVKLRTLRRTFRHRR